jgi:nucleoside-diphosphate-sugar epimerase
MGIIALGPAKQDQAGGIMDVGFIGLGNMGAEMARNLLKAGHRVTVYNRTRAKAQALAAKGAQMAERVADACRGEILITMLADDASSPPKACSWMCQQRNRAMRSLVKAGGGDDRNVTCRVRSASRPSDRRGDRGRDRPRAVTLEAILMVRSNQVARI